MGPGGAQTVHTGAQRPELQRILDRLVTGPTRVASGAAAFVSGPNGTWRGSAGVADIGRAAPMPADARMRLESVSKIYTATVIVRLAQEGRLRLGDTAERWLPGLLPYGNRITIRQLLTMSSGLIDNNDIGRNPDRYLARVKDATLRSRLIQLRKRLDSEPAMTASPIWWVRLAAWQPPLFPPGTGYHYSNIGYDILGLIATRAAGRPFPRLYQDVIFTPLRLTSTTYDPQGPIRGEHAHGYSVTPTGAVRDATNEHAGVGADGGIVADAPETAAFLTALMRGRLVDAEWVARMKGDALWVGGNPSGCAGPAYGWSGGGNGFKTNAWVDGDGGRVAVLLLNGRVTGDGADALAGRALVELYCAA